MIGELSYWGLVWRAALMGAGLAVGVFVVGLIVAECWGHWMRRSLRREIDDLSMRRSLLAAGLHAERRAVTEPERGPW